MTHRARVIAATSGAILPELANIVAGYAELSDCERLDLLMGEDDVVTVTILMDNEYGDRATMCARNTFYGIEITSSLNDDCYDMLEWHYFMESMNSRHLDLDIMDNLYEWSHSYSAMGRLRQELIDLWWSF